MSLKREDLKYLLSHTQSENSFLDNKVGFLIAANTFLIGTLITMMLNMKNIPNKLVMICIGLCTISAIILASGIFPRVKSINSHNVFIWKNRMNLKNIKKGYTLNDLISSIEAISIRINSKYKAVRLSFIFMGASLLIMLIVLVLKIADLWEVVCYANKWYC